MTTAGHDGCRVDDLARRLGDCHRGIGFNQLAVMLDCADAASKLISWNPNGTQLDACGSATRGVADILMRETVQAFTDRVSRQALPQAAMPVVTSVRADSSGTVLCLCVLQKSRTPGSYRLPLIGTVSMVIHPRAEPRSRTQAQSSYRVVQPG
jgi:diaminopimelate epimerase